MWTLVGLGNPGGQYAGTRHNVGFDLIDLLASRWKIAVDQKGPSFLFGSGEFRDIPVLLVKPMTFMNRSGGAFKRLLREPEVTCEESMIIYDDIHLPLGKIRVRRKGSHGGHNGLGSILEAAQTQEIPRLRIGIDNNGGDDWVDYVLSPFKSEERSIIDDTLIVAIDAVETVLLEGIEKSMNLFNR